MGDRVDGDFGNRCGSVRVGDLALHAARYRRTPGMDFGMGWVPDGRPLFDIKFRPDSLRPGGFVGDACRLFRSGIYLYGLVVTLGCVGGLHLGLIKLIFNTHVSSSLNVRDELSPLSGWGSSCVYLKKYLRQYSVGWKMI